MTPPPAIAPPNITIQPVTSTTLPAYRRMITTLLPIRYQDNYYAQSIANLSSSSLALCAVWHDSHGPSPTKPSGEIVAGIQCRLESLPPPPPSSSSPSLPQSTKYLTEKQHKSNPYHDQHPPVSPSPSPSSSPLEDHSGHDKDKKHTLYISTLCTLSPYRNLGIASALLSTIIHTALTHADYAHLTIASVYAHVWEANEEALVWYEKRGFEVEKGVVEGYYRRLRPSGGRVVRRVVRVGDYLGVEGKVKGWMDGRGGEEGGRGEEEGNEED